MLYYNKMNNSNKSIKIIIKINNINLLIY